MKGFKSNVFPLAGSVYWQSVAKNFPNVDPTHTNRTSQIMFTSIAILNVYYLYIGMSCEQ